MTATDFWAGATLPERREMSKNDDELKKEVDTQLSWRVGWPTLQTLPLETTHIDTLDPLSYIDTGPIVEILADNQISYRYLTFRYRHRENETPQAKHKTLLINARHKDGGNWPHAVCALRKHLREIGVDFRVEIIDGKIENHQPLYAIRSDDEAAKTWEDVVEKEVMKLLEGENWSAVNVFNMGTEWDKAKCSPTVMITTLVPDDEHWQRELIPNLRQLLQKYGLGLVVNYGECRFL